MIVVVPQIKLTLLIKSNANDAVVSMIAPVVSLGSIDFRKEYLCAAAGLGYGQLL